MEGASGGSSGSAGSSLTKRMRSSWTWNKVVGRRGSGGSGGSVGGQEEVAREITMKEIKT